MRIVSLFISIFLLLQTTKAQYLEFVENKGQWDEKIAFKGDMKIGAIALKPDGGYRMLQHNTSDLQAIHELFHPSHSNLNARVVSQKNIGLRSHVYEVSFLGANINPKSIAEKPSESYNNYFIGDDKSKWASGCKIFQAITYKNIYPNIDVRYYTGNSSLKYDFIVHPGGNPNQIALVFDGADALKINKRKLEILTSVTTERELEPYTFQPSEKGKSEIGCRYKLTGNIVTFKLDDYDKNKTLIIDPTKDFATFSGSTADNWGFTATYDAAGNFYGGGIVFDAGFPVTNGSSYMDGFTDNEESYKGSDIGIIKFSPNGKLRVYATYIGGHNGNEQPHSLVVDANNNLILAGRTNSSDYPKTFAVAGPGGGKDIVLTKLDNSGNILSSRVIGGSGNDGMNIHAKYAVNSANFEIGTESLNRNYGDDARSEVIVDNSGNILLASCTQSTDFFVTPNAFQKTNGGASTALTRKQDAVFIMTDSNMANIITSTYLGGNNDDAAFVLAVNPLNKNVYIAGGTASSDFPGDKTGVIGSAFNGGACDGFVAILNNDGSQLLKSTYIGTSQAENVYGIQFDKFGYPYVMGTTTGIWPVINANYFNNFGKQFIGKLQPDLSSYVYSTCFGTGSSAPNISPTAFLVDRCENVYVSGWGGKVNVDRHYQSAGTAGLPVTANAIMPTTDGSDFYFFVLERGAKSQIYGDFMGQLNGAIDDHVDGGTSRFDKNGVIYQSLCGNCGGPNDLFPTTPGSWSETNKSSNRCNLLAVKISLELSGVGAGVRSSIKGIPGNKLGCVPLTVNFIDTLAQGSRYYWNFDTAKHLSNFITTSPNNTAKYTYNSIGDYVIRLVSEDSTTCNIFDTSYVTIKARVDSAILDLQSTKIGDCFSNTFKFDTRNSKFVPSKPFTNNSFIIDFGDNVSQKIGYDTVTHTYPGKGIYYSKLTLIDTNYCNTPQEIYDTIRIVDNVKASFNLAKEMCIFDTLKLNSGNSIGYVFKWYIDDVFIANSTKVNYVFTTTGLHKVKLVTEDIFSCNKTDFLEYQINVVAGTEASFSYLPKPPRINTPVTFTNTTNSGLSFLWNFGDGDSLFTTNPNLLVKHTFQLSKKFNVCLIVENANGCKGKKCDSVQARVSQLYDVPSAFSPNGDGKNDKIYVRGYGIKNIKWEIYNRWGILMFTSNNLSDGWDGTFKGELQPQDVYHYTLKVEFWDDTIDVKTGDITLLR